MHATCAFAAAARRSTTLCYHDFILARSAIHGSPCAMQSQPQLITNQPYSNIFRVKVHNCSIQRRALICPEHQPYVSMRLVFARRVPTTAAGRAVGYERNVVVVTSRLAAWVHGSQDVLGHSQVKLQLI